MSEEIKKEDAPKSEPKVETTQEYEARIKNLEALIAKKDSVYEEVKRDMLSYKQEKIDLSNRLLERETKEDKEKKELSENFSKVSGQLKQVLTERAKEKALGSLKKEFGGVDLPKTYEQAIKGETDDEILASAKEVYKTFSQDFKIRKASSGDPIDASSGKSGIKKPAADETIKPLSSYGAKELAEIKEADEELYKQIITQKNFGVIKK